MTSSYLHVLEAALNSSDRCSAIEVKAALNKLSTEIRERVIRGSDSSIDFIQSSVRVLSRMKGRANADIRMNCLSDSGQYLYSHGKCVDAVVAGIKFEGLARLTGDNGNLSKAFMLQSMANAELGNISESLIQSAKALEIAKAQHPTRQAAILINLGVALNYAGLFDDAIPCFDRALNVMTLPEAQSEWRRLGWGADDFSLAALSNKAWSLFQLERFRDALRVMDKCIRGCSEPWDAVAAERRATRESMYVHIALASGRRALAIEHEGVAQRYKEVSHRARFYACFARALLDAYDDSSVRPRRLEELLASCESTTQKVDVLEALIRSYDRLGLVDDALRSMEQLISLVRRTRHESVAAMIAINAMKRDYRAPDNLSMLTAMEARLRAKATERKATRDRFEMLERLAVTADLKEEQSGRHGYRVGRLSALIAERLSWRKSAVDTLETTARLHDIGKIAIPDRILLASDELRSAERQVMWSHAGAGAELLANSNLPELRLAEEIARHHHEWWDGTGYPSKLSGKRIPIHARIVALADVFDALTHGRPYAPAWPIDKALEEIKQRRGTQFDPDLTDTFLALIEDLRREHADLDAFLAQASRNSPFLQARDRIRLMLEQQYDDRAVHEAVGDTVH